MGVLGRGLIFLGFSILVFVLCILFLHFDFLSSWLWWLLFFLCGFAQLLFIYRTKETLSPANYIGWIALLIIVALSFVYFWWQGGVGILVAAFLWMIFMTPVSAFIHGINSFIKYQATIHNNKSMEQNHATDNCSLGMPYYQRLYYDLVIPDYNMAIELNPKSAEAYYNRGCAYIQNGQYDLAITDCDKAIKLNPKYAEAYHSRGLACSQKKQYDLAITGYNKAIELDPKDPAAYCNRGVAYQQNGQYDLAITDYNKAIDLDSKSAEAYCNRAAVYHHKVQYDLAITDYNKAIELDPKDPAAYYNRGLIYYKKEQYDRAIADFEKVISISLNTDIVNKAKGYIETMRK